MGMVFSTICFHFSYMKGPEPFMLEGKAYCGPFLCHCFCFKLTKLFMVRKKLFLLHYAVNCLLILLFIEMWSWQRSWIIHLLWPYLGSASFYQYSELLMWEMRLQESWLLLHWLHLWQHISCIWTSINLITVKYFPNSLPLLNDVPVTLLIWKTIGTVISNMFFKYSLHMTWLLYPQF